MHGIKIMIMSAMLNQCCTLLTTLDGPFYKEKHKVEPPLHLANFHPVPDGNKFGRTGKNVGGF